VSEAPPIVVATIQKSRRERIRVTLATFKGHQTADIRVFIGDGPDAVVTRKGLTVRLELLPDLTAALVAAVQAAGLTMPESAQNAH
jgi:hypothetical protein